MMLLVIMAAYRVQDAIITERAATHTYTLAAASRAGPGHCRNLDVGHRIKGACHRLSGTVTSHATELHLQIELRLESPGPPPLALSIVTLNQIVAGEHIYIMMPLLMIKRISLSIS